VLEYIYNFFFSVKVEDKPAGCPFSKKTAADGQCPMAKSTEPAEGVVHSKSE